MITLPAWMRVKLFPDNCAPIPTYRTGIEGAEDALVDLGVDRERVIDILTALEVEIRDSVQEEEEDKARENLKDDIKAEWLEWLLKATKKHQIAGEIREWLVEL